MDINGDGHLDIISGSYAQKGGKSKAGILYVLWGKPNRKFQQAKPLLGTDGESLKIHLPKGESYIRQICTRPFAVDWNGDGHLDIVVGNTRGNFHWFAGQGKGKFQPQSQQIKIGTQQAKIYSSQADPFVIDWDNDGDLDIVSGSSSGGVQWAENSAGAGKLPKLSSFKWLIERPADSFNYRQLRVQEGDLKGPRSRTRIYIDDLNGDGKWDILVGDQLLLERPLKKPADPVAFRKQWVKAWADRDVSLRKARQLSKEKREGIAKKLPEAKVKQLIDAYQKESLKLKQHDASRRKLVRSESTGLIWLYLQK